MKRISFVPKVEMNVTDLKNERWEYLLALCVLLLLSVLVIYTLATVTYEKITLWQETRDESVKIQNLVTVRNNLNTTLTPAVTSGKLFGEPLEATDVNHRYDLLGITYSTDTKEAKIYINGSGGEVETYKAGDRLGDGVIVQSILPNDVFIIRNGVRERLTLNWEGSEGGAAPSQMPPNPSVENMNVYQRQQQWMQNPQMRQYMQHMQNMPPVNPAMQPKTETPDNPEGL